MRDHVGHGLVRGWDHPSHHRAIREGRVVGVNAEQAHVASGVQPFRIPGIHRAVGQQADQLIGVRLRRIGGDDQRVTADEDPSVRLDRECVDGPGSVESVVEARVDTAVGIEESHLATLVSRAIHVDGKAAADHDFSVCQWDRCSDLTRQIRVGTGNSRRREGGIQSAAADESNQRSAPGAVEGVKIAARQPGAVGLADQETDHRHSDERLGRIKAPIQIAIGGLAGGWGGKARQLSRRRRDSGVNENCRPERSGEFKGIPGGEEKLHSSGSV